MRKEFFVKTHFFDRRFAEKCENLLKMALPFFNSHVSMKLNRLTVDNTFGRLFVMN